MSKPLTHGHTIHLEQLDRSSVPYGVNNNVPETHHLWNAFDTNYHIGYLITWDGEVAKDTYYGKTVNKNLTERGMTELEAVSCVVRELWPEPVIVTDKEEVETYKEKIRKDNQEAFDKNG